MNENAEDRPGDDRTRRMDDPAAWTGGSGGVGGPGGTGGPGGSGGPGRDAPHQGYGPDDRDRTGPGRGHEPTEPGYGWPQGHDRGPGYGQEYGLGYGGGQGYEQGYGQGYGHPSGSPYRPAPPPYGTGAPGMPGGPGDAYRPGHPYDGYTPPGYGHQAPPGTYGPRPGSDDTTMALLAHLLGLLTSFIGPLVLYLAKRDGSPYVRDQAAEALNFQLTVLIAYVVCCVLAFVLVGFVLMLLLWIGSLIMAIVATVAASRGERYRYPMTIRFVS
ncbi:DUF4870 domain-containing protein [Streptosporangium sp. NPDC050855]|uniref:DUF4870 domain-containing protein n=1 Tax=Streptosporangium sp. NPDC050855 TaxID=3366194 RepID=UPI00378B9251